MGQQSQNIYPVSKTAFSKNVQPKSSAKPTWQNKSNNVSKFDQAGGKLGEFTGKLYRKEKTSRYGFVLSAELKAQGYDDVFVLGTELKDFKDGTEVTFTAFLNSKNQVRGRDLRFKKDESGGVLGEFQGKIDSIGPKF